MSSHLASWSLHQEEHHRLSGCHLRCFVVVEVVEVAEEEHDLDLKLDVLVEVEVVEARNVEVDWLVVEVLAEVEEEVRQDLSQMCDSFQRHFALPLLLGWALCCHLTVEEVVEVQEVLCCTCMDRIRYHHHSQSLFCFEVGLVLEVE